MQWFCMCARASVCGSGVCVCPLPSCPYRLSEGGGSLAD